MMRADIILALAYPDIRDANRRRELLLGLAFVSMGCVLRRFLGLPHINDGEKLLSEIKRLYPR